MSRNTIFTTVSLELDTAERLRSIRDEKGVRTDDLISELLDKHEEAIA